MNSYFVFRCRVLHYFFSNHLSCLFTCHKNVLSLSYILRFNLHLLHILCAGNTLINILWIKIYSTYLWPSNKLNKWRKRTFLITQFTFALSLAFIFSTFSSLGPGDGERTRWGRGCTFFVYLWRFVWFTPVPVQFFWATIIHRVSVCIIVYTK